MQKVKLYLDATVYERLKRLAIREGSRSVSSLIRQAIEEYLAKNEKG